MIANGQIPSTSVYEDETFKAVFDISPANKGHLLILPKAHADNVCALPADTAAKVLPLAAKLGAAQKKALGAEGFNLVVNTGEAAGQTVMHFHMHVIPRFSDDGEMVVWKQGAYADGEAAAVAEKIKEALEA
jgi:histidine triad (HIT) family protein